MLKYGFFNSVNGDRKYDADDISNWLQHLVSDGVFADPSNQMQVVAGTGMTVNVKPGWGFVQCKWCHNDADTPLTLQAAGAFPRIDRIVIRLDRRSAARSITLAVKTGEYGDSVNAQPPALTRNADVYELSLARITVYTGTTAITQDLITDERPDGSLCGFVAGLIDQIDAASLFAQYDAQFYAWFNTVKDLVKATTIVVQYTEEKEVESATQTLFAVDCPYFAPALDILNVYVNGERMYPDTDYVQNGKLITFTDFLSADDLILFEILKSVDTEDAETVATFARYFSDQIAALQQRLGGLSFRKLTKAEYDAIATKDPLTVYFVEDSGAISMYVGAIPVAGGGGSGASFTPVMQLAWAMPAVRASQLRQLSFEPSGNWTCDPAWYFVGQRDASIGGRGYTKQSALPAIGFVAPVENGGSVYSTLLLISDDSAAVGNGWANAASTSVQYGGITWYITRTDYAQGGAYDDVLGHFATFPQNLAYDGTTGTISAQAIQTVLAYVNATAN
jgi:hypothetical protein